MGGNFVKFRLVPISVGWLKYDDAQMFDDVCTVRFVQTELKIPIGCFFRYPQSWSRSMRRWMLAYKILEIILLAFAEAAMPHVEGMVGPTAVDWHSPLRRWTVEASEGGIAGHWKAWKVGPNYIKACVLLHCNSWHDMTGPDATRPDTRRHACIHKYIRNHTVTGTQLMSSSFFWQDFFKYKHGAQRLASTPWPHSCCAMVLSCFFYAKLLSWHVFPNSTSSTTYLRGP